MRSETSTLAQKIGRGLLKGTVLVILLALCLFGERWLMVGVLHVDPYVFLHHDELLRWDARQ